MFMLLVAALLVFSFAGCTQYDYSLLYWQLQQQKDDAQKIADSTDIPGLIAAAFPAGGVIEIPESL